MIPNLPPSLRRRFVWLVLVVGLLLGRGLTPEGWMPVAKAAGGIQFTLCPGAGPAHVMVMTPDGKMHHKPAGKGQAADHPCAFAGIAMADPQPPVPAVSAPMQPDAIALQIPVATIFPGRGLAAPPPPATGPPAFA